MTQPKAFLEAKLLSFKGFFNLGKSKKSQGSSLVKKEDVAKPQPFLFPKMILQFMVYVLGRCQIECKCCEFQTLVSSFLSLFDLSSSHNFRILVWWLIGLLEYQYLHYYRKLRIILSLYSGIVFLLIQQHLINFCEFQSMHLCFITWNNCRYTSYFVISVGSFYTVQLAFVFDSLLMGEVFILHKPFGCWGVFF